MAAHRKQGSRKRRQPSQPNRARLMALPTGEPMIAIIATATAPPKTHPPPSMIRRIARTTKDVADAGRAVVEFAKAIILVATIPVAAVCLQAGGTLTVNGTTTTGMERVVARLSAAVAIVRTPSNPIATAALNGTTPGGLNGTSPGGLNGTAPGGAGPGGGATITPAAG